MKRRYVMEYEEGSGLVFRVWRDGVASEDMEDHEEGLKVFRKLLKRLPETLGEVQSLSHYRDAGGYVTPNMEGTLVYRANVEENGIVTQREAP